MTDEERSLLDDSETVSSGSKRSRGKDAVVNDEAPSVLDISDSVDGSFSEYLKGSLRKIRSGQSGLLPILLGLTALVFFFQVKNSLFLSVGNLTNLLTQASYLVLFGFAEIWVLLLGEIDLSAGYNGAIGGAVMAVLAGTYHRYPWWLAILGGLAASTAIGALVGTLVIRLRIPSFIVSLAFLLGLQGVLLKVVNFDNYQGSVSVANGPLLDLVNGNLSRTAGWILIAGSVGCYAVILIVGDARRRRSGSEGAPFVVTLIKVFAVAASGLALVLVCNANRGIIVPLSGIPFCVPIILGFLIFWKFLLSRTRFGRNIYSIGGNAEAARRAGINLGLNRVTAFALTGLTAGAAGILYTSRLGGSSAAVDGGQLVLLAVAAAVIGGVSLFGGRGKMIHALIGGMIIAIIYNGMGLIGLDAATQDIVIGLVLLSAVSVEAISRRGAVRA
jgi:D-xylose transport system permease protein